MCRVGFGSERKQGKRLSMSLCRLWKWFQNRNVPVWCETRRREIGGGTGCDADSGIAGFVGETRQCQNVAPTRIAAEVEQTAPTMNPKTSHRKSHMAKSADWHFGNGRADRGADQEMIGHKSGSRDAWIFPTVLDHLVRCGRSTCTIHSATEPRARIAVA